MAWLYSRLELAYGTSASLPNMDFRIVVLAMIHDMARLFCPSPSAPEVLARLGYRDSMHGASPIR